MTHSNLYNIKSKIAELLIVQKIVDSVLRLIRGTVNKRKYYLQVLNKLLNYI